MNLYVSMYNFCVWEFVWYFIWVWLRLGIILFVVGVGNCVVVVGIIGVGDVVVVFVGGVVVGFCGCLGGVGGIFIGG